MTIETLIEKYGIISDQIEPGELRVVLENCEIALRNSGALVEFGCYAGTTSLFIQRLIEQSGSEREFHVYDSFVGLPEKSVQDSSPLGTQFTAGELSASKKTFIQNFNKAGLELPKIHKAWFSELKNSDVPGDICFAFLDGDYYDSIKISLELITPKLTKNAVIIVDDYRNAALPGAKAAADEWARKHGKTIIETKSLGIIHC